MGMFSSLTSSVAHLGFYLGGLYPEVKPFNQGN